MTSRKASCPSTALGARTMSEHKIGGVTGSKGPADIAEFFKENPDLLKMLPASLSKEIFNYIQDTPDAGDASDVNGTDDTDDANGTDDTDDTDDAGGCNGTDDTDDTDDTDSTDDAGGTDDADDSDDSDG